MRWRGLAVVLSLVLCGCQTQERADGDTWGPWRSVYDGYGTTTATDTVVVLKPNGAIETDVTHGSLVVTRDTHGPDLDLEVTVTTRRQLRTPTPNPWEVGWVLWHYTDDDHFYAICLKPNGWELSKQDPAYTGAQRFIASGNTPVFGVGVPHRVRIRARGTTMTVWVNDTLLTTITDTERPYSHGSVGLYTEDAEVEFRSLAVSDEGEQQ